MSVVPSPRDGAGRYVATARLGEGGTAEVWRAWDRHSERWCALKVLFKRYAERKSSRQRFLDEGRTVIQLNHRNIIEAWDLVEDAAQPFLVMEIAEGGSLRDWVGTHGKMAPRIAVDAAIQISKGIGAAHAIGVVHRDVKPHNILLSRGGRGKVTDFGIAQLVRADGSTDIPDWTKTHHNTGGKIAGTRGYMAPEQRNNGLAADIRTDIYGIGATLYTLLTGRVDTNLFAVDQDPSLMDGIHPELVPVIVQATKFRAEDRFQTVQELARALFDVREMLPVVPAGTPGLAPQLPPEPRSPYEAARDTDDPSTYNSYNTYDSNSSNPVTGVSAPPTLPPEARNSVAPGPASLAPTRDPRPRANLILSEYRVSVEGESPPRNRTRPLIVVATLVGILACLPMLDKIHVSAARRACERAHRTVQQTAARNVPAELSAGAAGALATLLNGQHCGLTAERGRDYVAALRAMPSNPKVANTIAWLEEPVADVTLRLREWREAAGFPGLVVTLGLEPEPPAPSRP